LGKIPDIAYDYHKKCVEIQNKTAELMKPGETVSSVYEKVTKMIDDDFNKDFMGFGPNKVKFLGHGIGLVVDEYPAIAKGFDEEIRENMVFAIEPKKGIEDFGMVGIENTFLITDKGGVSLTGDKDEIIKVD
jgi:Xaa-Pro aminopeptidase